MARKSSQKFDVFCDMVYLCYRIVLVLSKVRDKLKPYPRKYLGGVVVDEGLLQRSPLIPGTMGVRLRRP